jgi:hypothetical protein
MVIPEVLEALVVLVDVFPPGFVVADDSRQSGHFLRSGRFELINSIVRCRCSPVSSRFELLSNLQLFPLSMAA